MRKWKVEKKKMIKQKVEKKKMKMKIMKMKMKMKQWIKKKKPEIIKGLNDNLDEIIDKLKSFEDQIESLKKLEDLKEYLPYKDYDDKELKSKHFKIQLADMSNEIDEKLFQQIFGQTLIKLADKLINTVNKEENQIIVNNIHKNKDKLFEMDEFNNWVIQPNSQRINLLDTIDLILNFNEKPSKIWFKLK